MRKIRKLHPLVGGAALLLYLFMILFSQSQHDHGGGIFFKGLSGSGRAKVIRDTGKPSDAGCLSCHVLYDGHAPFAAGIVFNFEKIALYRKEILSYRQRFSSLHHRVFHLRGPPAA